MLRTEVVMPAVKRTAHGIFQNGCHPFGKTAFLRFCLLTAKK